MIRNWKHDAVSWRHVKITSRPCQRPWEQVFSDVHVVVSYIISYIISMRPSRHNSTDKVMKHASPWLRSRRGFCWTPASMRLSGEDRKSAWIQITGRHWSWMAPNFLTSFDLASTDLLESIKLKLCPGKEGITLTAQVDKLNVYTKAGFFKGHKDTPKGKDSIGSLVLCCHHNLRVENCLLRRLGLTSQQYFHGQIKIGNSHDTFFNSGDCRNALVDSVIQNRRKSPTLPFCREDLYKFTVCWDHKYQLKTSCSFS